MTAIALAALLGLQAAGLVAQDPVPPGEARAAQFLARAQEHEQRKDYKAAAADLTRALQHDTSLDEARYRRAKVYRELKQYDRALEDLDLYLDSRPDFAQGLYLRSNVRLLAGDARGAVEDLDRVITLNPRMGLAYSNRGQLRARLGDREGGLKDLRKALKLDPSRRAKIQAAIDAITPLEVEKRRREAPAAQEKNRGSEDVLFVQ